MAPSLFPLPPAPALPQTVPPSTSHRSSLVAGRMPTSLGVTGSGAGKTSRPRPRGARGTRSRRRTRGTRPTAPKSPPSGEARCTIYTSPPNHHPTIPGPPVTSAVCHLIPFRAGICRVSHPLGIPSQRRMLNPMCCALCSAPPLLRAIATTDACSVTKGPKKMKRKKAEDEDDGNDSDGDGAGASTAPKSQKHKKTKVPLHPTRYSLLGHSLLGRPRHSL